MKAVRCHVLEGPTALRIEDIPEPTPGPGEVTIRVRAAGINFADILMVAGGYQDQPPLPFTAGMEAAGEVQAIGEGVRHVKVGDSVIALGSSGAFAEVLCARAEQVFPALPGMSFEHAAAFPIAYGTSHMALRHRANLQAGETLVVHGAAGGVGLTAVEIGKKLGATVIAFAGSEEKLELCRSYGATHAVNHRTADVRATIKELTGGKGANVVYDPVGGDAFDASLRAIAWEGRVVVIGFASGRIPEIPANLLLVKNCAVQGLYWGRYLTRNPQAVMASMAELLGWYGAGDLKPHISGQFSLDNAIEAMQSLVERRSTGKVLLVPA